MNEQPAPDAPERRLPRGTEVITPGIVAGIFGAVIMGLFAMVVAAAKGLGFFTPMKLIAGTFLGAEALTTVGTGATGTVVLGIVIHLAVGAAFGVLYAAYLPRRIGLGAELGASLLYGAAIFLVMTWLILPWADPLMWHATDKGWLLAYHLAFGASLVLVLPIRREVRETGPGRQAHAPA